jgi:hypothetical protein
VAWHRESFQGLGAQEDVAEFDSDRYSVFCLLGERERERERERKRNGQESIFSQGHTQLDVC